MKSSSSAKSGIFTVTAYVLSVYQYTLSHLNKRISHKKKILSSPPVRTDGGICMVKLPSAASASFVLRFLETMCRHLQCDNLFSSQPFCHYAAYDRTKSGNACVSGTALPIPLSCELITRSPRLVSHESTAPFVHESKALFVSGPQSKKRRWMLRRWPAAASGVCPESRRPTLLPCRLNICAPILILQKVDDTAADLQCHHIWGSLFNAAWIYTSNHLVCRNIS